MRLYLIRHGQSTWNLDNRIQGHSNPPLSSEGRRQIERLVPRLKREKIDRVIASPLARAHESAQILAKGLGIPSHTVKELREIHLGAWEGKTPDKVNQLFNDGYNKWLRGPSKIKIPKAERLPKFRARAIAAVGRILENEKGERIAIVTHGGILAAVVAHWLKADFDQVLLHVFFENSSLTIAEVYDGQIYLTDINDTCHLRGPHFHSESPV